MADSATSARALPAAVLARIESHAGEERMEWYAMSPAARWAATRAMWATFIALGGAVDSDPDSGGAGDAKGGRGPIAADRRPGMHSVRRGGV